MVSVLAMPNPPSSFCLVGFCLGIPPCFTLQRGTRLSFNDLMFNQIAFTVTAHKSSPLSDHGGFFMLIIKELSHGKTGS